MMLRVLPKLLSFCVVCLSHRREVVQISALKTLKFVLETQGCSLDHWMVFILKGMLQTFPKNQKPKDGSTARPDSASVQATRGDGNPLQDEGYPGSKQASSETQPE